MDDGETHLICHSALIAVGRADDPDTLAHAVAGGEA